MDRKMPATKFVAMNIRERREALAYTQQQLATHMGLTQNAYSKIELGYTRITLDKLFQIAELLEVSPSSLFALRVEL